VQFQSRLVVFVKWEFQDLTFSRGSQLISYDAATAVKFDRERAVRATVQAFAARPAAQEG